eukprot:3578607-Prymnesium_polylepis.1
MPKPWARTRDSARRTFPSNLVTARASSLPRQPSALTLILAACDIDEALDGNSPLIALKTLTGCVGDQLLHIHREPDG